MELIEQRAKTHGDFAQTADVAVRLMQVLNLPHDMTKSQVHALDMISVKLARIVSGDPNHVDHWRDIAGYATIVAETLEPHGNGPDRG